MIFTVIVLLPKSLLSRHMQLESTEIRLEDEMTVLYVKFSLFEVA